MLNLTSKSKFAAYTLTRLKYLKIDGQLSAQRCSSSVIFFNIQISQVMKHFEVEKNPFSPRNYYIGKDTEQLTLQIIR